VHGRVQVVQLGGHLQRLDLLVLGLHRLDERRQLPQPDEAGRVQVRVVGEAVERRHGLGLQIGQGIEVEPVQTRRDLRGG
jgi:hypothetical protein